MKRILLGLAFIIAIIGGAFLGYKLMGEVEVQNHTGKSRVFVTGNIHGELDIEKLNEDVFQEQKKLTKDDNLIIIGDFGLIWDGNIKDEMILDNLNNRGFNILFVDGAHENFDMLYEYEEVTIYGGRAHKIRDNIFHLIRGEVYTIGGKKFVVFGGGESTDKKFREEGISYWKEEIPSNDDWTNLKNNIEKHNYYIDYVLTYTPPTSDLRFIGAEIGTNLGSGNEISAKLENIFSTVKYKKWYHSYYHVDMELSEKHINIYNNVVEINK